MVLNGKPSNNYLVISVIARLVLSETLKPLNLSSAPPNITIININRKLAVNIIKYQQKLFHIDTKCGLLDLLTIESYYGEKKSYKILQWIKQANDWCRIGLCPHFASIHAKCIPFIIKRNTFYIDHLNVDLKIFSKLLN